MEYFDIEKIREIQSRAVDLDLDQQRSVLFAGLNNQFVSRLRKAPTDAGQLYLDLNHMNNDNVILAGGIIPLVHWLEAAAHLISYLPDESEYFRDLALEIRKTRLDKEPATEEVPELILFDDTSSLISFNYIALAEKVGQSVAKLTITKYISGKPALFPNTQDHIHYFGTGWLIGKNHLMTNYHVINGRVDGECNASPPDIEFQTETMTVQFDYNSHNAKGHEVKPVKLCGYSKELDYAVVEIEDSGRSPLSLVGQHQNLTHYKRIPVNIIQHPGGEPKQIGFRNNLTAYSDNNCIAYFTDTNAGSSGSPVCDDKWQVIALHRAGTSRLGRFEYMGKSTAWINIGTRMDLIIDDLKERYSDLWAAIRADVV